MLPIVSMTKRDENKKSRRLHSLILYRSPSLREFIRSNLVYRIEIALYWIASPQAVRNDGGYRDKNMSLIFIEYLIKPLSTFMF